MGNPLNYPRRLRTLLCQGIAMIGFLIFLGLLSFAPPTDSSGGSVAPGAGVLFGGKTRKETESSAKSPQDETPPESSRAKAPRRPERFRPSAGSNETATRGGPLPAATREPADAPQISLPPEDLPLSYLARFRSMEDFHSFLDELPDRREDDASTMSLVRIEGLPRSEEGLRRLFESYRMEPFLFNPDRFNYLITSGGELLRSKKAIQSYIARVGRYVREDEPNAAYEGIRRRMIARARGRQSITSAITEPGEFERMELGVASRHFGRYCRRLERDTARQLTELTGNDVKVKDIARIDCRFRQVGGAMVLVPWKAYLGTRRPHGPIRIWRGD
jgi:hypothetical protein